MQWDLLPADRKTINSAAFGALIRRCNQVIATDLAIAGLSHGGSEDAPARKSIYGHEDQHADRVGYEFNDLRKLVAVLELVKPTEYRHRQQNWNDRHAAKQSPGD